MLWAILFYSEGPDSNLLCHSSINKSKVPSQLTDIPYSLSYDQADILPLLVCLIDLLILEEKIIPELFAFSFTYCCCFIHYHYYSTGSGPLLLLLYCITSTATYARAIIHSTYCRRIIRIVLWLSLVNAQMKTVNNYLDRGFQIKPQEVETARRQDTRAASAGTPTAYI